MMTTAPWTPAARRSRDPRHPSVPVPAENGPPHERCSKATPPARAATGHRARRSRHQPRKIGAFGSKQACMSSASRSGKPERISPPLTPSASISRLSATRMRMPRIQGRPPHCRGLVVIRRSRSCLSTMRVLPTQAPQGSTEILAKYDASLSPQKLFGRRPALLPTGRRLPLRAKPTNPCLLRRLANPC